MAGGRCTADEGPARLSKSRQKRPCTGSSLVQLGWLMVGYHLKESVKRRREGATHFVYCVLSWSVSPTKTKKKRKAPLDRRCLSTSHPEIPYLPKLIHSSDHCLSSCSVSCHILRFCTLLSVCPVLSCPVLPCTVCSSSNRLCLLPVSTAPARPFHSTCPQRG